MHPYTEALMASMPERSSGSGRLATIPGMVPGLFDRPGGCLFAPRCNYRQSACDQRPGLTASAAGAVRCHFPLNQSAHAQSSEVQA
jgi:dipeptide transport system ATP-binding protein